MFRNTGIPEFIDAVFGHSKVVRPASRHLHLWPPGSENDIDEFPDSDEPFYTLVLRIVKNQVARLACKNEFKHNS